MITLLVLLLGCGLSVPAWWLIQRGLHAWQGYEERVQAETRTTFDASFLFLDLAQLRPVVVAAAGLCLFAAAWLIGRWWGVVPVLCALLFAPGLLLRQMRKRRQERFDSQLPDLLMSLSGALRAGSGLQPALQHIISRSQAPLAQEFGLLLREQRLGVGFAEALQHLHARMPTESCALVVSALAIAARTGGGLADTLESIAHTLRSRQHWLGRVRALTAQGRMQCQVMAALPVFLMLVLYRLEPEAMAMLWQTWPGWVVLMLIVLLETIGILWIRRVATINV